MEKTEKTELQDYRRVMDTYGPSLTRCAGGRIVSPTYVCVHCDSDNPHEFCGAPCSSPDRKGGNSKMDFDGIVKYTVVKDTSFPDFERKVEVYLNRGWKPVGGICVINYNSTPILKIYQAMTKMCPRKQPLYHDDHPLRKNRLKRSWELEK